MTPHSHDLSPWQHSHVFDPGNRSGEARTRAVLVLTLVTMAVEIGAGWWTGSMALLADGWHMGTHALALGVAAAAYALARRHASDARFSFGTWKIEVLGAFTSALLLGVVALAMAWESVRRLAAPEAIQFVPALVVATIGLVVNVVSALVLASDHQHDGNHHEHSHHEHSHHEPSHDLNLRSAYAHVVADAFTSVLAIVALAAGLWAGWAWLDPAMGLVGAGVIAWWAKGLIADSARVLLDREMDAPVVERIRAAIQSDGDAEIADLHVWRVGRASYAAVVTVVAHQPLTPAAYRDRLASIASLAHVSVEVNRCPHRDCP